MQTLRKQVSDALRKVGYRRLGRVHIKKIDGDFSFYVDTGPIGFATDIAPFVGIRSEQVEAMISEFMELKPYDTTATAFANVGYVLSGEYRWWNEGANAEEVLSAIFLAQEKFRPFMTLATLPGVFNFPGADVSPSKPYALSVMALLNKDHRLAEQLLLEAESQLCKKPDSICEQFRTFESHFRSYKGSVAKQSVERIGD